MMAVIKQLVVAKSQADFYTPVSQNALQCQNVMEGIVRTMNLVKKHRLPPHCDPKDIGLSQEDRQETPYIPPRRHNWFESARINYNKVRGMYICSKSTWFY